MLVIGLTGGIGSGKTTAAELFAEKNVPVIDADEITRQLSKPSGKAYPALKNWFGKSAFTATGELDRRKLRQMAFSDPDILNRLEQLLHPLVKASIQEQLKLLSSQHHDYVIVAIPLLIEAQMQELVDRILIIDVSESLQLERVIMRDNSNSESIKKILSHQIDRQTRLSHADDILENSGDLSQLKQQINQLDVFYRQLNKSH